GVDQLVGDGERDVDCGKLGSRKPVTAVPPPEKIWCRSPPAELHAGRGTSPLWLRSQAVGSVSERCRAVCRERRPLALRRPGRSRLDLLESLPRLDEELPRLLR